MNTGDAKVVSKTIDEVEPDVLFHAPVPTGAQALKHRHDSRLAKPRSPVARELGR